MWPLLGLGRRRRVVLLQVEEGLAWGHRGWLDILEENGALGLARGSLRHVVV